MTERAEEPLHVCDVAGCEAAFKTMAEVIAHERTHQPTDLGWWTISGESLLSLLRRAHSGEDPDMLYAEEYANSDHERPTDA